MAYELKKAKLDYRVVDTPHVLRQIDKLNSSNILEGKDITLISIDIVDMFTNIPRYIGIQKCTQHRNARKLSVGRKLFTKKEAVNWEEIHSGEGV